MEFALAHPPLETPPPAEPRSRVLTIVERLDHHEDKEGTDELGGACVVRCRVDSDGQIYVAKIYDGVGYPLVGSCGEDCMFLADKQYSGEAAAYENMPLSLQGSAVPRYFGSWTFALEEEGGRKRRASRSVRLILIEAVNGECMFDVTLRACGLTRATFPRGEVEWDQFSLNPDLLPDEELRLDVLARVIEIDCALFSAGVDHRDMAPRNVILSPSASAPERVVVIDFDSAAVLKLSDAGRRTLGLRKGELPVSPIELWWGKPNLASAFFLWCPRDWWRSPGGVVGGSYKGRRWNWLCARWGYSEESKRFSPLSPNFLRRSEDNPILQELLRKKPELRGT